MRTTSNTANSYRWTILWIALTAWFFTACGIGSSKDRSVSEANAAIIEVDRAGSDIAEAIARLSDSDETPRDLSALREAGAAYLTATEHLNGALRGMAVVHKDLESYIEGEFLVSAEKSVSDCQTALASLNREDLDDPSLRDAITRIGRCIDRYARSVDGVSKAYSEISEGNP